MKSLENWTASKLQSLASNFLNESEKWAIDQKKYQGPLAYVSTNKRLNLWDHLNSRRNADHESQPWKWEVGMNFKKRNNFKYLGVNLNSSNNMHREIKVRKENENKCYFSINKLLFEIETIINKMKNTLHTSYLRPARPRISNWRPVKGNNWSAKNIFKGKKSSFFWP